MDDDLTRHMQTAVEPYVGDPQTSRLIVRDVIEALERAGYVLAPVEPTEPMLVAGAMNVPAFQGTNVARQFARERYAAMLEARPSKAEDE